MFFLPASVEYIKCEGNGVFLGALGHGDPSIVMVSSTITLPGRFPDLFRSTQYGNTSQLGTREHNPSKPKSPGLREPTCPTHPALLRLFLWLFSPLLAPFIPLHEKSHCTFLEITLNRGEGSTDRRLSARVIAESNESNIRVS